MKHRQVSGRIGSKRRGAPSDQSRKANAHGTLRHLQLSDISLDDAYDETGVCALWSVRTTVRPSYIGATNVLQRFEAMSKSWTARPIHGTMVFMRDGSDLRLKRSWSKARS
jgi:hypothetical protein